LDAKEYILKGADELFCQYGFKSVTMDDIARQLAVSKKTIYQLFKDKNELINTLIQERIISQNFQMNKFQRESDNAVQENYLSMQDLDFLLSTMNPMLFFDLQKYYPEAWKNFAAFKEKMVLQKVKENLDRGLREGYYRSDLNLEIIAQMRLMHLDFIFARNNRYDTLTQGVAGIMIEITRHYLFGICNEVGRKLVYEYDEKLLGLNSKEKQV
jgi:AcrR family transcriptional regulator